MTYIPYFALAWLIPHFIDPLGGGFILSSKLGLEPSLALNPRQKAVTYHLPYLVRFIITWSKPYPLYFYLLASQGSMGYSFTHRSRLGPTYCLCLDLTFTPTGPSSNTPLYLTPYGTLPLAYLLLPLKLLT